MKAFIKEKYESFKNNPKLMELLIYGIFGVLTTCVSIGGFELLKLLFPDTDENILNTISVFVAIVFAYVTNRKYVFKSTSPYILKEFFTFLGSRAISTLFEIASFYILVTLLEINSTIAKIGITFVVIVLNYILSKLIVFKKKNVQ